jgi:hypothetical protein
MAILPARITSTSTGALVSAWYAKGIPLVVCGAAVLLAIVQRRRFISATALFPIMIAVYWQAIQTLAGPGLRYRLPVEPVWAVIVGIAAVCLIDMLRARGNAR